MPDTAAVVVNHNGGEALAACVASLRSDHVGEVIVVDNASTDGSADGLATDPAVRVLPTGANLGYGAGANRGVGTTRAEFVLLTNADVVVHQGALATLRDTLVHDPTLAIVGPRIVGPDGARYPSARRFPSMGVAAGHTLLGMLMPGNRFTQRYRMAEIDAAGDATAAVDWVSGACFMARRRALEELGGFDESYFMYVEDLDLCFRAHRAGWGVAYVPTAVVTHLHGVSTARRPYRMLLAHHRSAMRFAWRATTGWRRLTLPGVALVLALRLVVACAKQALGGVRGDVSRAD